MPAETDHSREAEIVRIKCLRNSLCHSISTSVPNSEFEDKWNTISHSLVALGLYQLENKPPKNRGHRSWYTATNRRRSEEMEA